MSFKIYYHHFQTWIAWIHSKTYTFVFTIMMIRVFLWAQWCIAKVTNTGSSFWRLISNIIMQISMAIWLLCEMMHHLYLCIENSGKAPSILYASNNIYTSEWQIWNVYHASNRRTSRKHAAVIFNLRIPLNRTTLGAHHERLIGN